MTALIDFIKNLSRRKKENYTKDCTHCTHLYWSDAVLKGMCTLTGRKGKPAEKLQGCTRFEPKPPIQRRFPQ